MSKYGPLFFYVCKIRCIVLMLQVVGYERMAVVMKMIEVGEGNAISHGCQLEERTMGKRSAQLREQRL